MRRCIPHEDPSYVKAYLEKLFQKGSNGSTNPEPNLDQELTPGEMAQFKSLAKSASFELSESANEASVAVVVNVMLK